MNIRKPIAIKKAHHKLFVNLAANEYTTVLNANLMAQLKINFQFISAKVRISERNAKEIKIFY